MIPAIIICAVTCLSMIAGVLFFPKIKIGKKFSIDSYWVITLIGAVILLVSGQANFSKVIGALFADTAINPLKILVLFISMTILSIFLDELGFFRYLASVTLKRAKNGQMKLFLYLYLMVSVLTVFTSNDIIILSFTPFICYFAKNAKINPIPYLAAEFVAANTWSMALIIGNPTNIYLATAYGVGFLEYVSVMILPTLFAGVIAFMALLLLFRKKLSTPIEGVAEDVVIEDKLLLWVGIAHLGVCTVLLAIGSYIQLEMWLVSFISVISLLIFNAVIAIVRKQKPTALFGCIKRGPYQLIPFILSMFVMIVCLSEKGVTGIIGNFFGAEQSVLKYGITSFLASNIINNIPMSVLYSSIINIETFVTTKAALPAIYATVVGSNIGAFLTPIGALAGIMWSNILNEHGLRFGYVDFLKIGVTVAVPTLLSALAVLMIIL